MPLSALKLPPLLELMRPHQWSKNVLLFFPIVLAHRFLEPGLFAHTLLAAFCFSMIASAVYVLNDRMDIADDRRHPDKKHRPLAAGTVSPSAAPWICLCLILLGLLPAFILLPRLFGIILTGYFVANAIYSSYLKRLPVLDAVFLTMMFVTRIYAGGVAGNIPVTNMLLTFSFFFFLSIAFAKRVQEVQMAADSDLPADQKIRGYFVGDIPFLRQLGFGAGLASVLVLALYMESPEMIDHYRSPLYLWSLCPLMLYWIGRFWLITLRGKMNSDPILFTLKDPVSYLILGLVVSVLQIAYWL